MKLLAIFFVMVFNIYGIDNPRTKNPCSNPVFAKAQKEGLRSLTFTEIPKYYYLSWKCVRSGGNKAIFKKIARAQIEQDYNRSKNFKSWTSTWSYCSLSIVVFYYLEKQFSP